MKKTKQLFACLSLMTLDLGTAQADYTLNLMKGVTKVSNDIYDLHMLILWICVFIGIGVFGVMFYSIYHHRKSKGHQAAQFHENTTVEIIWTIIPTLILIGMAIPATKTLMELDQIQESDMSIKVTGHQWFWEYDYLDNGINIISRLDEASNKARQPNSGIDPATVPHYLLNVDKPLVIPTKKKIRFLFTSKDVIHSWWVPDLGWKKDANPGFINEAWTYVDKPGTYRGQCTELCGKDHGFMPIVVIAMDQADYDTWVNTTGKSAPTVDTAKVWQKAELVAEGAKVYEKNCATCHQAKGQGIPGTFPAITASKVVTGDIKAQTELILKGKGMMPAFAKMLNPEELAEVITFTRNDLGNKVGDEIQPAAIANTPSNKAAAKVEKKTEDKAIAKIAEKSEKSSKKETKKAVKKTEKHADMSQAELVAQGKSVYAKNCSSCHKADGTGLPGTFPALKNSPVVAGDIKKQVDLMTKGKGMMPAFGTMLSADDFSAVVAYTRNAFGNKVNNAKQPAAKADASSKKAGAKVEGKAEAKTKDKLTVKGKVVAKTVAKTEAESKNNIDAKKEKSEKVAHHVIPYVGNPLNKKTDDAIQPVAKAEAKGKTVSKVGAKAEAKPIDKSGKVAKKSAKSAESNSGMPLADLAAHGKSVYEKNCSSCHKPDGTGLQGVFPALKKSPVVTGDVKKQVEFMMKGKGMMPAFGTMLSADDFAAVVTYTRNNLGNSVGDSIQASAIKSLQSAKK